MVITQEIIENAKSYIPLAEKEKMAGEIAIKCLDIETASFEVGDDTIPLPDRVRENTARKTACTMTVLICKYLGLEDMPDNLFLPYAVVDEYAEDHILMQMERMKANSVIKNKVFDILSDYKLVCSMINSAIFAELSARNDAASRILVNMAEMSSPEYFQNASEQLKKIIEDVEKIKSKE